ncbi:MAG: SUMF1/EgtB/PvdO family nonheme iron enzyme [Anaerolineae bacterium]|nr:SUMF1/EgtB/PvdO family nonheme iron enzyme [Anaerolineae bacterium]
MKTMIKWLRIGTLVWLGLAGLTAITGTVRAQTGQSRQAGDTRLDPKGIEQVWVPAGCFVMGSDDAADLITTLKAPSWVRSAVRYEIPARETCLTVGYWIDKVEVTNKAFAAFVADGGYTRQEYWSESGWKWLSRQKVESLPVPCESDQDDHPRVCVTWYEAEAYAHWRGGRLPTEAEWEYAARGPESRRYPWGDEFDPSKANLIDSKGTTPVGSFPDGASWVGALDMSGNAMEWVQDWLSAEYPGLKVRENPQGPDTGSRKVEKGGWWGSNAYVGRASYKHFEDPPTYQDHHIGFRIVTPDEDTATPTPRP